MQPELSIIVPVYNAARYLPKCIESILSQLFLNFELLLINDGSLDNSGYLCDEYSRHDKRVRVFHQRNSGVSATRNFGINHAVGNWLTFIDADDWIANDTFSENMKIIHANQDVDCMFFPCSRGKKTEGSECIRGTKNILKHLVNHLNFEVWGRIFKRELIANIRFDQEMKIGEDLLFIVHVMQNSRTCYISDRGMYFYEYRGDSAMNAISRDLLMEKTFLLFDRLKTSVNSLNQSLIIGIFSSYLCTYSNYDISPPSLKYNLIESHIVTNMPFIRTLKSNLKLSRKLRYILVVAKIHFFKIWN